MYTTYIHVLAKHLWQTDTCVSVSLTLHTYHESAKPLLLNPFLLLLLLSLNHGVVAHHGFVQARDPNHVVSMELLEVTRMLQNT